MSTSGDNPAGNSADDPLDDGPAGGGEAADLTVVEDPFLLFQSWLQEAAASEPNDPNGMALATVDASGLPNVRMVLLKGVDEPGAAPGLDDAARGFVFYTNLESAKGRELAGTEKVALLFHWKSLRRQVRVRGIVSAVSDAEADAYFASRPRLSQIGAWASEQSRPLEARLSLEKRVAMFTAKFGIGAVPRPPHWSGFRVTPVEIEFWRDRPFRLHDRIVFRRAAPGDGWAKSRLYP